MWVLRHPWTKRPRTIYGLLHEKSNGKIILDAMQAQERNGRKPGNHFRMISILRRRLDHIDHTSRLDSAEEIRSWTKAEQRSSEVYPVNSPPRIGVFHPAVVVSGSLAQVSESIVPYQMSSGLPLCCRFRVLLRQDGTCSLAGAGQGRW